MEGPKIAVDDVSVHKLGEVLGQLIEEFVHRLRQDVETGMVNRNMIFLALRGRQLSLHSLSLRRDTRRRRGLKGHKVSAWITRPPAFTLRRRDIVSAEQPAAGAKITSGQGFVACLFPHHAGMTDLLSTLRVRHCTVRHMHSRTGGLYVTSARNDNGEHSRRPAHNHS